jgi:hypothetical protein
MKKIITCFLISFYVAFNAYAWAITTTTTVDGFVTKIDSPNKFSIGDTQLKITSQTQCRLKDVFLEAPLPAGWYSWSKETNLGSSRDGGKTSTTMCHQGLTENLRRVHVVATKSGGTPPLTAKEITFLRVHVRLHSPSNLRDGFVLEEDPPRDLEKITWLDGYPVAISSQSMLVSEPFGSVIDLRFNRRSVEPSVALASKGKNLDESSLPLRANDLVLLDAQWSDISSDETSRSDGNVLVAEKVTYMSQYVADSEHAFRAQFAPTVSLPNYQRQSVGTIQYPGAPAIRIVPNHSIQDWIQNLGNSLTPKFERNLANSDPTKFHLSFYIVHTFPSRLGEFFVQDTPMTPQYQLLHWDKDAVGYYKTPAKEAIVSWIISSPDGTVLIPDRVLPMFTNVAEIATMLSAAITAVLQKQEYQTWPPILVPNTFKRNAIRGSQTERLSINEWQNTQAIRVGIRQMFLAGYDIRQAPFAWAIALKQPVVNPMREEKYPDDKIPWYSSYAFSYVSQYYSDVDYSKLKRGEAEYQQFLGELRKADPEAFSEEGQGAKP